MRGLLQHKFLYNLPLGVSKIALENHVDSVEEKKQKKQKDLIHLLMNYGFWNFKGSSWLIGGLFGALLMSDQPLDGRKHIM